MPTDEAYWISPEGFVIPVKTRHIDIVLENLPKFGLDRNHLDAVYLKHGEAIGIEGDARSEILTEILNEGWIRLRYNLKRDCWTAQVKNFSVQMRNDLRDWVDSMLKGAYGNQANKYSNLFIINEIPDLLASDSFENIQKLFNESKNQSTLYFCPIENYKERSVLLEHDIQKIWNPEVMSDTFSILTTFKNDISQESINERNSELSHLIWKDGWGHVWLEGYWKSSEGRLDGIKKTERQFLILGNNKSQGRMIGFLKKMMVKYDQDAAIIKKPNSNSVFIIKKDGQLSHFGDWTAESLALAYCNIRGVPYFCFETAWAQGNVMSQMAFSYRKKAHLKLRKISEDLGELI